MTNKLISGIAGLILLGIGKIFNYFDFLGKTGDLIGMVGVIAILYALSPIISFLLDLFCGSDDSSYSNCSFEERYRKISEDVKRMKEEEEKKRREEIEDAKRREEQRKCWENNKW